MPICGVHVSACIITLDKETNIRDCLESIKWVAEIVVVDASSFDQTASICRQYTDRVVQRAWPGHVAQKNFALSLATHDRVLSLDADERGSADWDGYYFPRPTFHLGRRIRHGGWCPDYKLRLFRKGKARWEGVDPHDIVEPDGRPTHLKWPMYHYTYRDIAHHIAAMNPYTDIASEQKRRARLRYPFIHMLLNPIATFVKTYFPKRGFLDGVPGLIVAACGSFYVFLKYAKLWELYRGRQTTRNS